MRQAAGATRGVVIPQQVGVVERTPAPISSIVWPPQSGTRRRRSARRFRRNEDVPIRWLSVEEDSISGQAAPKTRASSPG